MSARPEKQAIVAEIRQRMEQSRYVLAVNYTGLTANKLKDLRQRLHATGGRMQIASNSFFRIAAEQAGWKGSEALLVGPLAMVSGAGDVTQAAKILREFVHENNPLVFKGGFLGAGIISAGDVEALATLPPRKALLGQLVGTLAAPMSQLAGVLRQKVSSLVYVLKAIEEKKSKG